jgi:MFS transporter, ACS family, DAL5 transporter family protein
MSSPKSGIENESDSASQHSSEKIALADSVPGTVLRDAELVTSKRNVITKDGIVVSTKDSNASLSTNIFSDPEIKAYYIGVYEKAQYECRRVFDADLTWSKEEEKKLVRKLDWHGILKPQLTGNLELIRAVCLWACIMFFSLQVDRGNISQAVSGTLLKDLKLNTNGE